MINIFLVIQEFIRHKAFSPSKINIDDIIRTVEKWQGNERKVILMSLVRSNTHQQPELAAGFLTNLKRINVALTRARCHLFIVGDFDTIARAKVLKPFCDFYTNPKKVTMIDIEKFNENFVTVHEQFKIFKEECVQELDYFLF